MLLKQICPINSLKKVAEECGKNKNEYTSSIMGILIDVTAPLFRERDKEYIVQLKLIDQTINQNCIYGVMIKYCSVYLFMQKDTQASFCNKIGQVIYLDQFIFSIWHSIKLETKFLSRTQKLCCYDAEGGEIRLVGILSSADNSQPKLSLVGQRIEFLKDWFKNKFFLNQFTPMIGISVMNNYTLMAEPFIMILKYTKQPKIVQNIQSQKQQNNQNSARQFQDSNGNHFFIRRSTIKRDFPNTLYVYLRGVKCLGNFFEIIFTETGNILGLPGEFSQHYQKIMNYCAVSRFNQKFLLKNHKPCLLSRITYVALETTPIERLMKEADNYTIKQSTRQQAKIEDYYMIQGVAINFQGQLHMFHTEYQVIIHSQFIMNLSDDEKKQMVEDNKLSYLYEGYIGMIDRSSERTGKIFYVHLFSNEPRTQFYDSSLITELVKQVGSSQSKKLEKMVKEKIQSKLRNLIAQSTFQNTISMLLQPIKADTLIYRLTNTIFD